MLELMEVRVVVLEVEHTIQKIGGMYDSPCDSADDKVFPNKPSTEIPRV